MVTRPQAQPQPQPQPKPQPQYLISRWMKVIYRNTKLVPLNWGREALLKTVVNWLMMRIMHPLGGERLVTPAGLILMGKQLRVRLHHWLITSLVVWREVKISMRGARPQRLM